MIPFACRQHHLDYLKQRSGLDRSPFMQAFMRLAFLMFCFSLTAHAQESPGDLADGIDLDPLRQFIPRPDIYMPIPGGVSALTEAPANAETIEEQAAQMHGGLIVGYCLKASCRYVTHLVVLQVCHNQIESDRRPQRYGLPDPCRRPPTLWQKTGLSEIAARSRLRL